MNDSRLPFFGVVRVSGDDAASFLHGQLSNHIEGLQVGEACLATYNTPKGRVLANMLVVNRGSDFLLVMAADLLESTVKRLRMFVLRAKVVFELLADYGVAGRLPETCVPQPAVAPTLSFPGEQLNGDGFQVALPHGGVMQIAPMDRLPEYCVEAEQAWNRHEILSGFPWVCAATSEVAVAQMLNQHVIGGVHFKKGCYPGQEVIARAQYRGQVKRGLAVLRSVAPLAVGETVSENGEEAGTVLSSVADGSGSLCLAVIKFAAASAALSDQNGQAVEVVQVFFAKDE